MNYAAEDIDLRAEPSLESTVFIAMTQMDLPRAGGMREGKLMTVTANVEML